MIENGAGVTANLLRDVCRRHVGARRPASAKVVVADGTLTGVVDFDELSGGDPAVDPAAAWALLPTGAASRFFTSYAQADKATIRRAGGPAALTSPFSMLMGQNGDRGLLGRKPAWSPMGAAALHWLSGPPAGSGTEPR